jgi:hypothetical protein
MPQWLKPGVYVQEVDLQKYKPTLAPVAILYVFGEGDPYRFNIVAPVVVETPAIQFAFGNKMHLMPAPPQGIELRVQPYDEAASKFAFDWWTEVYAEAAFGGNYKRDGRINMSGIVDDESVDMIVHGLWPKEIEHETGPVDQMKLVLQADSYDSHVQINITLPKPADHVQLDFTIEPPKGQMTETLARYGLKIAGKL